MYNKFSKCTCGHSWIRHIDPCYKYNNGICVPCFDYHVTRFNAWHSFKLDNLAYVEQMARERGLI